MASVARPKLLASSEGLADAGSADFSPPVDTAWEVHSVIVSGGPTDIERIFDPDESGTLGNAVTIRTIPAASEMHAMKLEVTAGSTNPTSGLRVTNNSGSAINVYLIGIEIT